MRINIFPLLFECVCVCPLFFVRGKYLLMSECALCLKIRFYCYLRDTNRFDLDLPGGLRGVPFLHFLSFTKNGLS